MRVSLLFTTESPYFCLHGGKSPAPFERRETLYFPMWLSVCTSAVHKPTTPVLHFESPSVPGLGDKRNFARRCGIPPAEPKAKDRVVVPTISKEMSPCAVLLRNAVLTRCVLETCFLPFNLLALHRAYKRAVLGKSPLESLRTGGSLCQSDMRKEAMAFCCIGHSGTPARSSALCAPKAAGVTVTRTK